MYDEARWDRAEGIEAGTKIDDIWACPVCFEYDTFNHINEEVFYIEDDSKDLIEQSHYIEASKIDNSKIEVTIGRNNHPMWDDHRILWVWLYDEYKDLVDERFLLEDDDLVIEFDDFGLDDFEIQVKCSKHNLFAKKFEF